VSETVQYAEKNLTECQISALKELVFARFTAEKQAMEIAYRELQRRLDVLNHAHEEAKQKEIDFYTRKEHDGWYKDFTSWRDTVNAYMNNLTGKIAVMVGAVSIILFLLQHYWK
jgi:hypothetical protein